jgi:hypothetical protein
VALHRDEPGKKKHQGQRKHSQDTIAFPRHHFGLQLHGISIVAGIPVFGCQLWGEYTPTLSSARFHLSGLRVNQALIME